MIEESARFAVAQMSGPAPRGGVGWGDRRQGREGEGEEVVMGEEEE